MAAFEYVALNASGRKKKGVLEGDSSRQVRQLLREQQLIPVEVTEVSEKRGKQSTSGASRSRNFRGAKISTTDMAMMMRQVATLVASGMPLEECLYAVAEQTDKANVKRMVLAIRGRVLEGHSLATGLGDFPQAFDELYRSTIDAGEQSGHLDVVLERLADYAEARQVLKQKTQVALIYPAILVFVAFGAVAMLMAFVVPDVISAFISQGGELPLATRILVAASDATQKYGLAALILMFLSGIAAKAYFSKPKPKFWLHGKLLKLPLIGKLTRGANSARFARTLSILTASGVPVLHALKVSGQVITNLPMRHAVEEATGKVREGVTIHKALAPSKLFPPMMLHLIANGERSGELEAMLDRAAITQERELETTTSSLLGVMEPLIILGMGVMVLFIVMAMLLPIFNLRQTIG